MAFPVSALDLRRTFLFLRDPVFPGSLALGFVAWALPEPAARMAIPMLLLRALAEELFFRFGLQETLSRRLPGWPLPILSPANLLTSLLFALLHLFSHPPLWALGTFLPSLVFGLLWDRHRNVLPCWLVHAAYNLLYFYRP